MGTILTDAGKTEYVKEINCRSGGTKGIFIQQTKGSNWLCH